MQIKPNLTEESLSLAKIGQYTFWVDPGLTKDLIKKIVGRLYDVHVTGVKTLSFKANKKRNFKGRIIAVPEKKKAVMTLKKDEKIDAFEVKKGKK